MSRISVALPVYNASTTLAATLDSLVQQTLRDFDVVLLDDASQDNSLEIAARYEGRLQLRVIHAEHNLGISGARNRLLAEIDADYVAILDHDDLCHPERLQRQQEFLDSHPDIDVVGSTIACFTQPADVPQVHNLLHQPTCDAAIKTRLLLTSSVYHPSAMVRRGVFTDCGGYEAEFSPAEDYALWCRAALQGKRFANLDEPLLYYRFHARQTSEVQGHRMRISDIEIKRFYIRALLGGESGGSLAELFCRFQCHHDKHVLASTLPGLMPPLLKLNQRVACADTYAQLVSEALGSNIRSLQ